MTGAALPRMVRIVLLAGVAAVLPACGPRGGGGIPGTHQSLAVCTAAGDQIEPQAVSDGSGGMILIWLDTRGGFLRDVYAQRVTAAGALSWAADGVPICTATGDQYDPHIASDGAGGAIIAWADNRGGQSDIYAQRINGAGAVQWATDGLPLCSAPLWQAQPRVVSDGSGGAVIGWVDGRSGNADVYAQRVNSAGTSQWAVNGVSLCTALDSQDFLEATSDGAAGAIFVWRDFRNGSANLDVFAQRVDGNGVVQWAADGVAICQAPDQQPYPQIASDGAGGAIITWADFRGSSLGDVYCQRVNGAGVVQWATDGVAICSTPEAQHDPRIISDGSGGAILAWPDYRDGSDGDLYAQRVNSAGVAQWTSNGVAVCKAANSQGDVRFTTDGSGGTIFVWVDSRDGIDYDLFAQRLNGAGQAQWTNDGVAVCTASSTQATPQVVSDGSGGVNVLWRETPTGVIESDVHSQAIDAAGFLKY